MKTLVVYYSMSGTTKQLAQEAAKTLHADVEELHDHSNWKGLGGFFRRLARSASKGNTSISETKYTPGDYDTVLILSPIWGATIAPAVRTYLQNKKNSIKSISLIVVGGFSDSSGSEKEVKAMGLKVNHVKGFIASPKAKDAFFKDTLPQLNSFLESL